MTCKQEEKFQIAGFGTCPVIFHRFGVDRCGVSIWNDHTLTYFAETPWLLNHLAHVRLKHPFQLPLQACGVPSGLAKSVISSSVETAIEALQKRDILILAEAVTSIYGLQKMVGAPTLPHRREVAKRHVPNGAVYLYGDQVPKAVRARNDIRVL